MKDIEKYIVYSVLIATIVAYFQIFRFIFIPYPVMVLSQVAMCGILIVFILLKTIYFPEGHLKMNFKWPVIVIAISIIPSFFIAYYYHNQNFIVSVYANRALLFFLLYFFLHVYKVPVKIVLQVIVIVGVFAVFLYYVQLAIYPKLIMKLVSTMETRGTIRMFIPGMLCTVAAYFYFLNRFFESNNFKFLLLSLVMFSAFILQGTRILIFSTFFLTLVNLILSNRVRSKVLISFLISLAAFAVFMAFREIFMAIGQVSSKQASNFENDVRLRAAKFFLTSFMPNKLAYIFGNSDADAGSPYDLKLFYYSFKYGFFLNDIGVIGDYVRYGIFFTVASFYLILKALFIKTANGYNFLKYYIVSQCFTFLTGKGFIGGADIVFVCTLYIFDIQNAKLLKTQKSQNLNP